MSRKAKEIVDAVLEELKGRSGVGNELEGIEQDQETWEELNQTLVDTVDAKLAVPGRLPERSEG